MHLETERLRLVPTPRTVVERRLRETDFHDDLGGRRVFFPAEWPGDALVLFPSRLKRAEPDGESWGGTLVRKADDRAIGQMGFKGGPDADGVAELGYGLNPEAWGRGYATEMAAAMVAFALAHPRVRRVTAKTAVGNVASRRVLEKVGLVPIGAEVDPEDGDLIVWAWPETP